MRAIPAAWRRLDGLGVRHPVLAALVATLVFWLASWAMYGRLSLIPLLMFIPVLGSNLVRSSFEPGRGSQDGGGSES